MINGKDYTCADVYGNECFEPEKTTFGKWADKLDEFVHSGRLGPLGNGTNPPLKTEQIAHLGLVACSHSEAGSTSAEFLESARQIVANIKSEEARPFWLEAQKTICPEVTFKD